jgi:hypothetical protein
VILITSACGSARVADGSAVVVSPGNPVVVEYLTDDRRMETLLFEQSSVEAELAGMFGRISPSRCASTCNSARPAHRRSRERWRCCTAS